MTAASILVPLDGSRFGEAALPSALGLARALAAPLELVSVYSDDPMVAGWRLAGEQVAEWFGGYLAELSEKIAQVGSVPVTTTVIGGPIAQQLEERAARTGTGFIVMSTHGRGAVSRAWLGSVADHVVRHVAVPVLLVRPTEDATVDLAAVPRFGRVLVALDGSERAEVGLEWAVQIGRAFDASYRLLRAVPPHYAPSPYLPHVIEETHQALERERDEAAAYLTEVARRLRQQGVTADTDTPAGVQPASAILHAAQEWHANLIAVATHGRGELTKLMLGSVADKVVRGASVPVLVIRPRGAKGG